MTAAQTAAEGSPEPQGAPQSGVAGEPAPGIRRWLPVAVLLPAVGLFVLAMKVNLGFSRPVEPALPVLGQVNDIALTERSGQAMHLKDLGGNVWIGALVFTQCGGPCPTMCAQLAGLQKDLLAYDRMRFVCISVDPEHDTPEVLAAYARNYNADPERWLFLTGDRKEITQMARQSFLQAVDVLDDGTVLHGTRYVLIDRWGRLRGYYNYDEPEKVNQMAIDAVKLLRERPR